MGLRPEIVSDLDEPAPPTPGLKFKFAAAMISFTSRQVPKGRNYKANR